MTRVSGVLGQKLGYDKCPYLSFFVQRFEDEIFDLMGRRDLNTKYTIFDLRCYDCLWCNYECKTAKIFWEGQETTTGYSNSLTKRDSTPLGDNVVSLGKMIVYYRICLERQFNEDKTFWWHLLTRHSGDYTYEKM